MTKVRARDLVISIKDVIKASDTAKPEAAVFSTPGKWETAEGCCYVTKEGDMLVGITLAASERELETFEVEVGESLILGKVKIRPGETSYALDGIHCLPLVYPWHMYKVRATSGRTPQIDLVYAIPNPNHRLLLYTLAGRGLVLQFASNHLMLSTRKLSSHLGLYRGPLQPLPPLLEVQRRQQEREAEAAASRSIEHEGPERCPTPALDV